MNSGPSQRIVVQKYGGATVATPQLIKDVAERVSLLHKSGTQVIAVVSAMGQTTNHLLDLAHQISPSPNRRELDMLLTTGERISMALLSMALLDKGIPSISLTGSQAGILTDDSHFDANILEVKGQRILEALEKNKVVVLAGFQGVSPITKEITTLGRGGSDTTAVAVAGFVNAERCEILKDVPAVFSADPKIVANAIRYSHLCYSQLCEMTYWGAKVLHYKSVRMAAEKKVLIYVGLAADAKQNGTLISGENPFHEFQAVAITSHESLPDDMREKVKTNSASSVTVVFSNQAPVGQLESFVLSKGLAKPDYLSDQSVTYFTTAEKRKALIESLHQGLF
jgi:aspartate kinase